MKNLLKVKNVSVARIHFKKVVVLSLLCLCFSSCSKEERDWLRDFIDSLGGTTPEIGLSESKIVGIWTCSNVSWPEYNHYEGGATVSFSEDHTFSISKTAIGERYTSSGTWSLDKLSNKIVTTATWPKRIVLTISSYDNQPTSWWNSPYGGQTIVFGNVYMPDSATLLLKDAIFKKK